MAKFLLHILLSGILTATSLMVAGCSDDALGDEIPGGGEPSDECTYIRFSMSTADSGIPGGSRAEGTGTTEGGTAGEDETPGTTRENAVVTVDLLVFDAETDVLTNFIPLSDAESTAISSAEGVCVPIFAKKGQTVTVYAAVNMPENIRSRYAGGAVNSHVSTSAVSTENDYWTVINEFVPGSDGMQSKLEADGGAIPMTGVFRNGADGTGSDRLLIEELHATREDAIAVAASVSRIVAKMHLLVKPVDNRTPQYVTALKAADATPADRDNPTNWVGWIRPENVHYMPNGTNRSTYLFPHPNAAGNLSEFMDRNMELAGYIVDGKFNARLWGPDYVCLDGNAMQTELGRPLGCRMATAEIHDAQKLENTKSGADVPNRYTKGMYCLENYFNAPANETFFETYEDQMPAVTHMSIAAKLTPRVILTEGSFVSDMDEFIAKFGANPEETLASKGLTDADFTNEDITRWNDIKEKYFDAPDVVIGCLEIETTAEDDATRILDWSLMLRGAYTSNAADELEGKLPSGTFYVYDRKFDAGVVSGQQRYLYLTAGAVYLATGESVVTIKSRSVPHIGGWGYYYTYIDGKGTHGGGVIPYSASQVSRNVYYIVTVLNFGFPGGSKSDPEYIKVNTNSVGWDYRGNGGVTLH